MNRKLWVLNVVLVAIAVYAGFQLRKEWQAAKAREAATLRVPMKVLAAPKYAPLLPDAPVVASGYVDVAQKFLFDKSRNPTVVVDVPPPPPPKPVPALPVYHGLMNLGGGLMAMLSVSKDAPQQAIHPGEAIGQFKLVDVNSEEMTLEWEGLTIHKRVDDLTAGPAPVEAAAAPAAPAGPTAPPAPVKSGPGEMTQFGFKICAVNDGNAEGSVMEGYKKVMHATPFGQSCTWDPVGK
ncbi:conserved exported hypothetical protein [Candidatus Sulfopaludibacter sp. SbA6]|nr:conserved exported hypothetical protein [Candidatus Sulfopaludibacter sp. SbA6]